MKWLKKLYRALFERGCIDYTKPYIDTSSPQKLDVHFMSNKTHKEHIIDDIDITYFPRNSYLDYQTSCGNGLTNIGYHNSRINS